MYDFSMVLLLIYFMEPIILLVSHQDVLSSPGDGFNLLTQVKDI